MRGLRFQTTWLFLQVFSLLLSNVAADYIADYDSPAILNYRPFNVSLSTLYFWVGSYFNGTAHFEFHPYAGLSASQSQTGGCPALRNKTITKDYTSVLGLTEPSTYNAANDPLNALLTFWPLGYDFRSKDFQSTFDVDFEMMDTLEYAIYSSDPTFGNQSFNSIPNNFNWSLEETQTPSYILSSVLTAYDGVLPWIDMVEYPIKVNTTATNCNGTEISSWQFQPMSWNTSKSTYSNAEYFGFNYTDPVINLRFDGQTANFSMHGYFAGDNEYWTQGVPEMGEVQFAGEFTLTFEGVIDLYHSDVLRNDTATPTWLRTVGYQNNSLNVGYTTSGSAGGQMVGLWSLAMIIILSHFLLSFC